MTDASGLLISCEMLAARRPATASFSDSSNCFFGGVVLGYKVSHLILAATAAKCSLDGADECLRSNRSFQQHHVSEGLSNAHSSAAFIIDSPARREKNQGKIGPRGLLGYLRRPLRDRRQRQGLLRQNQCPSARIRIRREPFPPSSTGRKGCHCRRADCRLERHLAP